VSRFPFGYDSKKSKKNEGNGRDEEQNTGVLHCVQDHDEKTMATVALDRNHPGCGGGLRMLVKYGTEVGC